MIRLALLSEIRDHKRNVFFRFEDGSFGRVKSHLMFEHDAVQLLQLGLKFFNDAVNRSIDQQLCVNESAPFAEEVCVTYVFSL